jgi:small membrane protein
MSIKILLSIPLLLVIFAFLRFTKNRKSLSLLVAVITIIGVYFIFFPEASTNLAHIVGVGRGADLMFYFFILLFLYFFYIIYGKIRQVLDTQTEIIRIMAIKGADNKTKENELKY